MRSSRARCGSGSTSPTAPTCSSCGPSSTCCAPTGHEVASPRATSPRRVQLCERFGIEHEVDRPPPRRPAWRPRPSAWRSARARSCAGRAATAPSTSRSGTAPTTSRSPRAAAHPVLDDVRLRVGDGPAHVNCRLAQAVVVPEAIPPERLDALRRARQAAAATPGLKEEYYLADFEPDPAVLDELGARSRRSRSSSCARRPRSRSTTASRTTLFGDVLAAPARARADRRASRARPSSAPS